MNRLLLSFCTASGLVFASFAGIVRVLDGAEKPAAIQDDQDELKGEVKTIDFESKHLDDDRKVKVYLPPGHDRKKSYPVIYAADGFDGVSCELIEELIASGKVPPLILIGIEHGSGQMRQREYMPGRDQEAFDAHEKFFIEEIIPWAEQKWGASRERKNRVVFGFSNSAPFALAMANRHPDLFGHAFAMMVWGVNFDSFGKELKQQKKDPTRYILVGGDKDAHGVEENQRVEQILKKKRFPVTSSVIEGIGHNVELPREQLPVCVEATFGKK